MSNIFGMLNVARTALMVQQKAIDVTGNNIANVNSDGYTRQRLHTEQAESVRIASGTLGSGVVADKKIQRLYDQFVTAQLNSESGNLGKWESQRRMIEKAELLFNTEGGNGIDKSMSEFFNAWQDLINNPSGTVERGSLVHASEVLVQSFNQLHTSLERLQKDTDGSIEQAVTDINLITQKIYDLNSKIMQVEISGHSANEYRDERDLLLRDLSSKIDVNAFEDGDGFLVVMVAGGRTLVDRGAFYELSTEKNASGFQDVLWTNASGVTDNITSDISNGNLRGWIESRDTLVEGYLADLNTLAQEFISQINGAHSTGFALDGSTGRNFFLGTDASTILVNPDITSDNTLIATAATLAGVPGDNGKAIEITELQNIRPLNSGTATFDEYYSSIVATLGSHSLNADLNFDHETRMVEQLEFYREEVSGVSLDEEMVNLVRFQHAYNAAAKLVSTVDQMLDSLIGIVR